METSNIAQALSSTWSKSKVLPSERCSEISNALLRVSGATLLYRLGKIPDMKDFANNFMKNREGTTLKYYIMNTKQAAKSALDYSVGLYNILNDKKRESHCPKLKEFAQKPLADVSIEELKVELKNRLVIKGQQEDGAVARMLNNMALNSGSNYSVGKESVKDSAAQDPGKNQSHAMIYSADQKKFFEARFINFSKTNLTLSFYFIQTKYLLLCLLLVTNK